jgi:hypothetical protein
MLDQLRKRQKVIVYVVAAAFILSLAGTGGYFGIRSLLDGTLFSGQFLGKVNGTKITPKMYQQKIQEITTRYQQQGQPIDDNMRKNIEYSAWEELVNTILWDQHQKEQDQDQGKRHQDRNPERSSAGSFANTRPANQWPLRQIEVCNRSQQHS